MVKYSGVRWKMWDKDNSDTLYVPAGPKTAYQYNMAHTLSSCATRTPETPNRFQGCLLPWQRSK